MGRGKGVARQLWEIRDVGVRKIVGMVAPRGNGIACSGFYGFGVGYFLMLWFLHSERKLCT